jgi:hypothetical protein
MTTSIDIAKFQTTVERRVMFGKTTRKVELDIMWISCGYYSMTATRIEEEGDNEFIEPKTDFHIFLTPEWIQKVVELYPSAETRPRDELYKPFYEDFATDKSMLDMGQDILFQAFKHQLEERVIITNYHFNYGVPDNVDVFNIEFEEFQRLKELLDDPNGNGPEIFYSGCRVTLPVLDLDSSPS